MSDIYGDMTPQLEGVSYTARILVVQLDPDDHGEYK